MYKQDDDVFSGLLDEPKLRLFGEIEPLQIQKMIWGNRGKMVFDPNNPACQELIQVGKNPYREITITIHPLNGMYPVRRVVNDWANGEWNKFIRPSLIRLGLKDPRLIGKSPWKYCEYRLIPTGRSYQRKNVDGSPMFDEHGEPVMVDATTIEFVKFFPDEKAMYYEAGEPYGDDDEMSTELDDDQNASTDTGTDSGNNHDHILNNVLPLLFGAVNGDMNLLRGLVDTNPLFAQAKLTFESPEVQNALNALRQM